MTAEPITRREFDNLRREVHELASLRTEVSEMRGELRAISRTLTDFTLKIEPLLLARSGEEAKIVSLRTDIDRSHGKHRGHYQNLKALDNRIDRIDRRMWYLTGATAGIVLVFQVLLKLPALFDALSALSR